MAFGNYEFPHSHNYDSDLRELIALVKEYRDDYDDILSSIDKIQTEFEEIVNQFNELNTKVDSMFDYIDDEIATEINKYRVEFNKQLYSMQQRIEEMWEYALSILPLAKDYADAKDEVVKTVLRAEMSKLFTLLSTKVDELELMIKNMKLAIIDPLTGKMSTLGSVVETIRDNYRVHALTNNEYTNLNLTNTAYSNFQLTNKQYILESKPLLRRPWFKHINPITGMLTTAYNVSSWIATMCAETLTASEYAAQDLTNNEYAALNLTNEEYFFTQAADLPWA